MFDPIAAAEAIRTRLEASVPHSENLRRLDDDAVAALKSSGLTRIFTPARFGGHEMAPRAQILGCAAVAHGCPAASWVLMVCGAHSFVVGRFPEQCQQEVFGNDPELLIAGTLSGQGTVEPADGGWILDGRWQFGSGVDHSPWLLIGARPANPASGVPGQHVVVPRADIEVENNWYSLGMRGTGSKDLIARRVFVPAHRAMESGPLFLGTFDKPVAPVYRLPVMQALAAMLAGTVLGTAERGVADFVEYTMQRRDVYYGGRKAHSAAIQRRVGEAAAELDAARLLLERICKDFDEAIAADRPPLPVMLRARIRRDTSYVVELCRRAVERVFAAAGGHAIYDHSKLQKLHRDINTACHHQVADFDNTVELWGRLALGLEAGVPDVLV